MHTLESLKRKINTAADLLSVVKTMKSLAAVNIRQFEEAALSLEEYNHVVDLAWAALVGSGGTVAPSNKKSRVVFLVLGSDQGMCGQFNELMLEAAMEHHGRQKQQGAGTLFWTVGERMRAGLEDMGEKVDEHFSLPGSLSGVNERVQILVQTFETRRHQNGMDALHVLYHRLVKGGFYEPVDLRVLPLDRTWQEKYKGRKWPSRCLPMLGLGWDDLFRHLFRQYLFVSFYRALVQSLASENAARLRSMQAAEKNILEMEEGLQARFRETRQNVITAELLDIISGFEALSDEECERHEGA